MKRWIWRALAFLLIGAVINVAVAWGCARLAPLGARTALSTDQWQIPGFPSEWQLPDDWEVSYGLGRRRSIATWFLKVTPESGVLIPDMKALEDFKARDRGGNARGALLRRFHSLRSVYAAGIEDRAGFPLPALRSRTILDVSLPGFDPSLAPAVRNLGWLGRGIEMGKPPSRIWNLPAPLPLDPLPVGFMVNTAAYAALTLVIVLTTYTFRRRVRQRRGLCPGCAYPTATSPLCTECGKPVKPRTAAAT